MENNHKIQLNLFKLSWPLFIQRIIGGVVTFTDTLFLSMISDEVAASVGALGSVLLLGYFIIPQFTTAGTSLASQYIGAKKFHYVIPTYIGNIVISTSMGIFLSLAIFLFSAKIGLWLGMTETQNLYASQYLQVIAFNFIFVGVGFSYASILASKTLTQWIMITSIITSILNIILNWVLMKGVWIFPEMGIRGIALATVISYVIGFIILFYLSHVRLKISFFIHDIFSHIKKIIGNILKIGIPSAIEPFSYTVQNFVVSVLIIRLGVIAMGANTYVLRLIFLDLTVSWTLTAAGQIIMSHYLGANKLDKVNKIYIRTIMYSMIFAFINILIYLIFSNNFLSIFTKDEQIKQTAFWILFICLFMEPIRAVNICGGVALKTVGDGKFSAIMGILFMWGIIPVIIFSSRLNFGIIGLWSCLLIDEIIRAVVNFLRWKTGKWKIKIIIKQDSVINREKLLAKIE